MQYNFSLDDSSMFFSFEFHEQVKTFLEKMTNHKWESISLEYSCSCYFKAKKEVVLAESDIQELTKKFKDLKEYEGNLYFDNFEITAQRGDKNIPMKISPSLSLSDSSDSPLETDDIDILDLPDERDCMTPHPPTATPDTDWLQSINRSTSNNVTIKPYANALCIKKIIIGENYDRPFYICSYNLYLHTAVLHDAISHVFYYIQQEDLSSLKEELNKYNNNQLKYINPNIFPEMANITIEKIKNMFYHRSNILKERHLPVQLGILIGGIPGTGKTVFVQYLKEVLSELFGGQIHSYDIPDLQSLADHGYALPNNGMLIFDDVESALTERIEGNPNATILTWLLQQLDGGDKNVKRLIIFVTNHPEFIDDALLRPGRLDYKIEFDIPSTETLIDLLLFHTQDDISYEKAKEIIIYCQKKMKHVVFANISLLCRLMYTDIKKDITSIDDWKSIILFMAKTTAYRNQKTKIKKQSQTPMGFMNLKDIKDDD